MAKPIEQKGRLIRMDDFPSGDKARNKDWNILSNILKIFENYHVNYLLATSPMLYNGDTCEEKINSPHMQFLKDNVVTGKIVMHGFNHGFHHRWDTIVETWEKGGEFINMSHEEISSKYDMCNKILSCLDNYDPTHFVPPFNAINQNLLDVLNTKEIKFIHLNSLYYDQYKQYENNFYNIEPLISENARTYADSPVILENINDYDEVITMHWVYDQNYQCIEEISKIVGVK
tara:strand:+ start:5549 stop:6241 length:693 start_codon:yes stop_codon:yes gene_type:complete